MTTTKPFDISKRLVWEAYKRVKANAGAAGVDTTADFIGQPSGSGASLGSCLSAMGDAEIQTF